METFKDHPQLGRFTLRDEGTLITERHFHDLALSAWFRLCLPVFRIRDPVPFWTWETGSGIGFSGSRISDPRSQTHPILWYLRVGQKNFLFLLVLLLDSGSGMDKNQDPRSVRDKKSRIRNTATYKYFLSARYYKFRECGYDLCRSSSMHPGFFLLQFSQCSRILIHMIRTGNYL